MNERELYCIEYEEEIEKYNKLEIPEDVDITLEVSNIFNENIYKELCSKHIPSIVIINNPGKIDFNWFVKYTPNIKSLILSKGNSLTAVIKPVIYKNVNDIFKLSLNQLQITTEGKTNEKLNLNKWNNFPATVFLLTDDNLECTGIPKINNLDDILMLYLPTVKDNETSEALHKLEFNSNTKLNF